MITLPMKKLFKSFEKMNILVVGDIILDKYTNGKVDRVSPEAPVPVFLPRQIDFRLGGASNVALNIKNLGASCTLCGYIGDDYEGKVVEGTLQYYDIDTGLVTSHKPTICKERLVANNQQIVRIDNEKGNLFSKDIKNFEDLVKNKLNKKYDAIIISDYNKGSITRNIVSLLKKNNVKIIEDTKKGLTGYQGVFTITPNLKEIEEMFKNLHLQDFLTFKDRIRILSESYGISNVLLTKGEQGLSYFSNKKEYIQEAYSVDVFDVSGAGDTVIASYALAINSDLDIKQMLEFLALTSSIVVKKRGTSSVSKQEILNLTNK